MKNIDISSLCYNAAKEAGDFLKASFADPISQITKKADGSFSTNIDHISEKLVVSKIKSVFPNHTIIGEESGLSKGSSEYTWIIDPLDGTHNFIKKSHNFGVSVGVALNGEFIIGAIYLPMFDEFYFAEKNSGTMKNDIKIRGKDCSFEDSTIIFDADFKSNSGMNIKYLSEISRNCFGIRILGASSRELTYIAEGVLDGAVQFNDPAWDFAAAAVILSESGSVITSLDGSPLNIDSKGFIAGSKNVHKELCGILKG